MTSLKEPNMFSGSMTEDIKGLLFNIQKFSLHDGSGIRTIVFFKGCPLSCKWCSNPESQRPEPILLEKKHHKIPDSRLYSVEEIVRICMQDRVFYEESGGGVTLSGGEPLTQPKYAAALLNAFRKEGLHTVLETSGFAPTEIFIEVSDLADLVLFDIKHYDRCRHIEGTGMNNDLILVNLKNTLARKIPVLPRLPVIPGYNNSLKDAYGFAAMFSYLGLDCVQLLPFHQFGEQKYDMLNIDYTMRGIPQLHQEDLEEFRQIIADSGINCFF
jgi:pyruvate formate lyase activating enzyme